MFWAMLQLSMFFFFFCPSPKRLAELWLIKLKRPKLEQTKPISTHLQPKVNYNSFALTILQSHTQSRCISRPNTSFVQIIPTISIKTNQQNWQDCCIWEHTASLFLSLCLISSIQVPLWNTGLPTYLAVPSNSLFYRKKDLSERKLHKKENHFQ